MKVICEYVLNLDREQQLALPDRYEVDGISVNEGILHLWLTEEEYQDKVEQKVFIVDEDATMSIHLRYLGPYTIATVREPDQFTIYKRYSVYVTTGYIFVGGEVYPNSRRT